MRKPRKTLGFKVTFTDDVQPGLRAIVRQTGTVTFHPH